MVIINIDIIKLLKLAITILLILSLGFNIISYLICTRFAGHAVKLV